MAGEEAMRLFCTPPTRSLTSVQPIFKTAEKLHFSLNGNSICGFRCNKTGGKKILLLHGFTSTCQHFAVYVQPLIDKGYEVLAFDAPAHGASSGKEVNALDYAAMILQVNKLYGPVDGYIAHSFGGISLALALESLPPDPQKRVVLIAPATETTSAIDGALKMLTINNPVLRKAMDETVFIKSGHHTEWFSIRRAVKNIKAQILWLHDEDDDITPIADARKVATDNHPNISFHFTKGLGHRRIYKSPEVVQEIVNFF